MTDIAAPLDNTLTAADVAAYLQSNPDFFVDQPDLLAELRLPHESGAAISLVERQVSILRERNIDMRNRLSKLLENARENDKLFDKSKRLVLALLEGQDMGDVVDALYYSFSKEFDIHFTSLLIFGNVDRVPSSQAQVVNGREAQDHLAEYLKSGRATCGHLSPRALNYLFGQQAANIGSAAMIPLVSGSTYGILAIGNCDPHYYRSSMGTLFLSYIAEVLNRLLPPYLDRA
ncbi:MAG: DUF484 family protein [Cellvibrio sp.]